MNELWKVIADLALELHLDRMEQIASVIERLASPDEAGQLATGLGSSVGAASYVRLLGEWRRVPQVTSTEVAAALRASAKTAEAARHQESVKLVWTGPSTNLVPVRHTEQVLREVIDSARQQLFIVSFVAYEVESVVQALNKAHKRGVGISLLLESSDRHGGRVSVDSVKKMREAVLGARVFIWSADAKQRDTGGLGGVVHAKCAVADGRIAFITSANLSTAAMERNMELGVMIEGGHLPNQLDRHLQAMITTKMLVRV
jgi:cardiolipin synthase